MKKSKILKSGLVKTLLIIFFLILSVRMTFAEYQWAKTYGGAGDDFAQSIQQTSDGGYLVAGSTHSFDPGLYEHVWVLKLNADGTIAWQKTYGTTGEDHIISIQQTSDGGYTMAGYSIWPQQSRSNTWVLRLNPSGTVAWQTSGITGHIRQTSDGGYVLAYGNAVSRLSTDGTVNWQKKYETNDPGPGGYAASVQQTSDGGYIVAGTYTKARRLSPIAPPPPGDFWVLKLNADGTVAWQKAYGGAENEWGASIQETSDGGYIIAGVTSSFGTGQSNAWVLKLNTDGTVAWQKTYGGAGDSGASSIQQTSDGGYIMAGYTGLFSGVDSNPNGWVLKLDESGNLLWQKTNGEMYSWGNNSVQQTSDDGYIMAGSTRSFGAGGWDFWVLKLDNSGDIPNCSIIGTFNVTANDTKVVGTNIHGLEVDTNVVLQTDNVTATDTNASENIVCPNTKYVTVQPATIEFNETLVGSFSDEIITVTNGGSEDSVIDSILSPFPPYSKLDDTCSGRTLSPGASCTVTVRFSPLSAGSFNDYLQISGAPRILLIGVGHSIIVSTPLNNASFDTCSLYSLPTFSWNVGDTFGTLELQFSSDQNFSSIPVKVKASGTAMQLMINSNIWRTVLSIPKAPGGTVYWRVIGTKADRTTALSDVRSIIIEPAQPVTNPTISPTNKSSSPQLSWNNNCNTKFKVWFGSDNNFTKNTTYTFNVKDPNNNGGVFVKTLTSGQWIAITNLVRKASDQTIYWYVESWDGLGRHDQTGVMSFVFTD